MSHFEAALSSLRPGVAWVLPGEQVLANVEWPEGIAPPTQAEVDAEVARLTTERTQSRQQLALTAAIQAYVDAPAQAWGYDDARSAVSYVGDPFPAFNAEGVAILNFRSECWAMARVVQQEVMAGERAMPTVAEMLALLPEVPERPTV
jgi:hypothetical protein